MSKATHEKIADDALARIAKLKTLNTDALAKIKDLQEQVETADRHMMSYADAADTAVEALIPLQARLDEANILLRQAVDKQLVSPYAGTWITDVKAYFYETS